MEVRLDRLEGSAAPEDTFVSLRIGDVQKQSRLVGTRQFHFPDYEGNSRSVGRLEVFKRLGWVNVNLGGARGCYHETQDVEIPVEWPNRTNLPMRISAQGPPEDEEHISNDSMSKSRRRAKERLDVAHRYISKHRLEEILADLMREVIDQKPSDPHSYMSTRILDLAVEKGVRADRKAKAYEVLCRSVGSGLLKKTLPKKRAEAAYVPPPAMKHLPHTEFVEEEPMHKSVRQYDYADVDPALQARLKARKVLEEKLVRFIEAEAEESNAKRGARQALEAALEELSSLLPDEVLEKARCVLDAALHNEGAKQTAATKIQAHMRGKASRQRVEEVKQEARDALEATLCEEAARRSLQSTGLEPQEGVVEGARTLMLSSGVDGSLGRTLKEIAVQQGARDAMMSACKSGDLARAMKEMQLQQRAKMALVQSGSDGRLKTAFHELESRRQADIRSCRRTVTEQLVQATSDGRFDISMKEFMAQGRCNPTSKLDINSKKMARTSLAQAGFDGRLVAAVDAANTLGPGASDEDVRIAIRKALSQEPRSRSDTPYP